MKMVSTEIRRAIAIVLLAVMPSVMFAGKEPNGEFAESGKVTMAELEMKECSWDKNADAMLLLDLGQMHYRTTSAYVSGGKFRIVKSYYRRYKIFTERGVSKADQKFNLYAGQNEAITNIRAKCYNVVGGEIVKNDLLPADIHKTQRSEYTEQVSFAVPGVKAGSVFELSYDIEQSVSRTLPTWYFTSDIPAERSSITVGYVDAMIYYVDQHLMNKDTLAVSRQKYTSDVSVHVRDQTVEERLAGVATTYTSYRVPAYRDEPYVSCNDDYRSWIAFQLVNTQWPLPAGRHPIMSHADLSNELYAEETFEPAMRNDPVPLKYWQSVITDGMKDEEKAKIIYEYIRSNISCSGMQNLIPTETNGKIWKNKVGSRTDINMILVSALSKMGVKAYPMLVGDRRNGEINTQFPMLEEYVGVDVLAVVDGRKIVLDASEKYLPFGEAGEGQLNTPGWVLESPEKNWWYNITDTKSSMENVMVTATVSEDAVIHGTMEITYTNHNADGMIRLKNTGSGTAMGEYLKHHLSNAVIESVRDSIVPDKCYFFQKIKFNAQAAMYNDGNIFMNVPVVYGPAANPFVHKERVADVDFGYRDRQIITFKLTVPEAYTVDSVYKAMRMNMSDTSASFMSSAEISGPTLIIQQKRDYFRPTYEAAIYPAFYEFQRKLYDYRQKPVILRKKS